MKTLSKIILGVGLTAAAVGTVITVTTKKHTHREGHKIFVYAAHKGDTVRISSETLAMTDKAEQNPSNFVTASPGDTLVINADNSYFYFGNVNGTASQPITVINQGAVINLSSGFAVESSSFINFTGSGTADHYGFKITNTSGVAMCVYGLSHDISFSRIWADNCVYGATAKNEQTDYPCQPQYWWPAHMYNLKWFDCLITNAHQEGMYFGSTDPVGTQRGITCNGVMIYPRPTGLKNISVSYCVFKHIQRQAINISCTDSGYVQVLHCNIYDCGNELNPDQGTGIFNGDESNNIEIGFDTIRLTYNYNLAIKSNDSNYIHDCIFDSAGYCFQRGTTTVVGGLKVPSILQSQSVPGTANIYFSNVTTDVNTAVPSTAIAAYGGEKVAVFNVCNLNTNGGVILNQTGCVQTNNCGAPPPPPPTTHYFKNAILARKNGTTQTVSGNFSSITGVDSLGNKQTIKP